METLLELAPKAAPCLGGALPALAVGRVGDKGGNRRRAAVRVDGDHGEVTGIGVPALAAPDNPAKQVEARESVARLLQALEALPAAQREAFLLHEEAGLSVAEIAAVTGAGEEAAKSRLRGGRSPTGWRRASTSTGATWRSGCR